MKRPSRTSSSTNSTCCPTRWSTGSTTSSSSIEARPEDGSLDLLGLYDGIALTERDRYGFGELPDRIVLFREPLLAIAEDLEDLKDEIHVTLVHEIAHFYGIDDDQLHELGWA